MSGGWISARGLWPGAAASVCLAGGAVTMGALALVAPPAAGIRTHWSYWGGTVGDLALPVVVYGLTRGCSALPRGRLRSAVLPCSAVTGALAGALSQAAWLADPRPEPNWLLVAPHTFSAQGWYHAVFLTVNSAYVAGIAGEFLQRAAVAPEERIAAVLTPVATTAVLSACGLFAAAIVADSAPTLATSASRATAGLVLGALTAGSLFAALLLQRVLGLLALPALVSATFTVLMTAALIWVGGTCR